LALETSKLGLHDAERILILEGPPEAVVGCARAAVEAGVWAVEVDVRQGVEALTALVGAGLGVFPGAGGVKDAQRAWEAVEAGARFLAAEPLSAEIAAVCEAADVTTIAVLDDDGSDGADAALSLRPAFLRVRGAGVPGGDAAWRRMGVRLIVELPGGAELGRPSGNTATEEAPIIAWRVDAASVAPDELRTLLSEAAGR